jgi:hypothetical protein
MKDLLEKLENNYRAFDNLEERIYEVKMGNYWLFWASEDQKEQEIQKIFNIQKRVLKMRYRLLENIKASISYQMNFTSLASRKINLKVA